MRCWIVLLSKWDLVVVLICDVCLRNSLILFQVNIVNDFIVVKWCKVIFFCYLCYNLFVLF